MIFKPIGPSRQFRILADRQHDNEDSNGCRLVSVTCDGVSRDLDSIFLHGLGSTFDNHQNFLAHPEFLEDGTTAYNFDWKLTAHKMISAAEYLAARNESTRTGNAADIIKNISLRFDVTCHEAVQPNEVWPLQHNVALDVEIQIIHHIHSKVEWATTQ
jgi:hypothetical protein